MTSSTLGTEEGGGLVSVPKELPSEWSELPGSALEEIKDSSIFHFEKERKFQESVVPHPILKAAGKYFYVVCFYPVGFCK